MTTAGAYARYHPQQRGTAATEPSAGVKLDTDGTQQLLPRVTGQASPGALLAYPSQREGWPLQVKVEFCY